MDYMMKIALKHSYKKQLKPLGLYKFKKSSA
jgi:hypothetical protein